MIKTYQTDFLSETWDGHHQLAAFASAELAASSASATAVSAELAAASAAVVAASAWIAVAFVAAVAACAAAGSFVALVHPFALDAVLVDS